MHWLELRGNLRPSTCFSAVQICMQLDMIGLWGNPFPRRSEWPGDDDEPNDLENKRAHARLMTVLFCLSVHVCLLCIHVIFPGGLEIHWI